MVTHNHQRQCYTGELYFQTCCQTIFKSTPASLFGPVLLKYSWSAVIFLKILIDTILIVSVGTILIFVPNRCLDSLAMRGFTCSTHYKHTAILLFFRSIISLKMRRKRLLTSSEYIKTEKWMQCFCWSLRFKIQIWIFNIVKLWLSWSDWSGASYPGTERGTLEVHHICNPFLTVRNCSSCMALKILASVRS